MWAGFEETNKGQCRLRAIPLGAMTPGTVTTSRSEGQMEAVLTEPRKGSVERIPDGSHGCKKRVETNDSHLSGWKLRE